MQQRQSKKSTYKGRRCSPKSTALHALRSRSSDKAQLRPLSSPVASGVLQLAPLRIQHTVILLAFVLLTAVHQAAASPEFRLDPAAELSSPFVLPRKVFAIEPGPACFSPSESIPSSFGFDGGVKLERGAERIDASAFSLHGQTCGSGDAASGWKLPVGDEGVLLNASAAFSYVARSILLPASDDPLGSLPYLLAEPERDGGVICGKGLTVSRWLLVRPSEDIRPLANAPEDAKGFEKGGRYSMVEVVDEEGVSVVCGYGEDRAEVESRENVDSEGSGVQGTGAEPAAGGGLQGAEIAGIVAGIAGVVLAIAVVILAAVLWRRQRMSEQSSGADESQNGLGYESGAAVGV